MARPDPPRAAAVPLGYAAAVRAPVALIVLLALPAPAAADEPPMVLLHAEVGIGQHGGERTAVDPRAVIGFGIELGTLLGQRPRSYDSWLNMDPYDQDLRDEEHETWLGGRVGFRYEHGRERLGLTLGPTLGIGVLRLGLGPLLELRDGDARVGVSGDAAILVTERVMPYFRWDHVPHAGAGERVVAEVGVRMMAGGGTKIRRRDESDRTEFVPALLLIGRMALYEPEGWEIRMALAEPLYGFSVGVTHERLVDRRSGEEGRGASLEVAWRQSLLALLESLVPGIVRRADLTVEAGGSVGGLTELGFRGALFVGGNVDLRVGPTGRDTAPNLHLGYRYQAVRAPVHTERHLILFGVGVAGIDI